MKKEQVIKLKGGAEVLVDWATKTQCKKCGKKIYWAKTKTGKLMPIEVCGLAEWQSHFAGCPFAKEFRKSK